MDTEYIAQQKKLLATWRSTLAYYLGRYAKLTSAYIPPDVFHGIEEAREHIGRIKETLRSFGVSVEDLPDDSSFSTSDQLSAKVSEYIKMVIGKLRAEQFDITETVAHGDTSFLFTASNGKTRKSSQAEVLILVTHLPYVSANIIKRFHDDCFNYVYSQLKEVELNQDKAVERTGSNIEKIAHRVYRRLSVFSSFSPLDTQVHQTSLDYYPVIIAETIDQSARDLFLSNKTLVVHDSILRTIAHDPVIYEIPVLYDVKSSDIFYTDKVGSLGKETTVNRIGRKIRYFFLP